MPKCTVIKTGATISKEASERVEKLKEDISELALLKADVEDDGE